MSVICVAGIDPSGGAGLAADMRALNFLGLDCCPIASTITAQNSLEFFGQMPVSVEMVESQIDALLPGGAVSGKTTPPDATIWNPAFAGKIPKAVKIGLLGNAETIEMLAAKFGGLPVVVDPVLRSSSGAQLADEKMIEVYREKLFPAATLITPNAHEASALSGIEVTDIESAKSACLALSKFCTGVLVKGGHFEREKGNDVLFFNGEFHMIEGEDIKGGARGTGCTYSVLIAGYLASGFEVPEAVKRAKIDMPLFLKPELDGEKKKVWLAVEKAVGELVFLLPGEMIAEVGNNIAFALEGAGSPDGMCSLDSRLILKGRKVVTFGRPVFGRDSHVGRVVLAAMRHFPELRCAMNLRYSEEMLAAAKSAGLTVAQFDRTHEPAETSSMEWGTSKALGSGRADVVFDLGSVGKEPMIRLLARNPEDLLTKLALLVGRER